MFTGGTSPPGIQRLGAGGLTGLTGLTAGDSPECDLHAQPSHLRGICGLAIHVLSLV